MATDWKALTRKAGNVMDDVAHYGGKGMKWGKGVAGKSFLAAGVVGALVAAPFIISSARNNRRYDPDAAPLPRDISDPVPQVLEAPVMPQQETLMGQPPVEGPLAQRELMRRGGMSAGINPSSPDITGADGRNVIDGGAVQSLGR